MEQTSGKSFALRESVTELFAEQKVDHERSALPLCSAKNRPQFISVKFLDDVTHVKEKVAMEEYGQRNNIIKMILFVIFILFSQIVSSHVEDSTILIQGYYCTVYKKSEQADYYKQLLRAKMGLSFSHPIDFYTNKFFLPISIDSLEANLDRIYEYESQQKNTLYFIPQNNEHKVLEKTGIKCEKTIQTKILLDFAIKNSPFYMLENDTIHLYKFTYIKCLAIEKPISFFDSMWGRLFLSDYIDNNRNVKTIYIITEIDDCQPVFLNNKRINIWVPELSYSDKEKIDQGTEVIHFFDEKILN